MTKTFDKLSYTYKHNMTRTILQFSAIMNSHQLASASKGDIEPSDMGDLKACWFKLALLSVESLKEIYAP